MFRFTRFPPHSLCIQLWVAKHYFDGVSPFGYSRINALLQLPWTFRRLRVLLRQLVPRHSSYTLCSLFLTKTLAHFFRVLVCLKSTAMQFSKIVALIQRGLELYLTPSSRAASHSFEVHSEEVGAERFAPAVASLPDRLRLYPNILRSRRRVLCPGRSLL